MSTKWFDPRDLLFKSPFGAVPCGADVSFCFRPERGAAVTRCELLAHGEFADQWTTVELTPAQEDGHVVYRGIFTAPDDVELVWYHFRLSWADGGTSCYGKKRPLRVGRGRALAAHGLRRHTQNARVVRPRRDVSDLPRPLPPR